MKTLSLLIFFLRVYSSFHSEYICAYVVVKLPEIGSSGAHVLPGGNHNFYVHFEDSLHVEHVAAKFD